jgi:hypothetical protein
MGTFYNFGSLKESADKLVKFKQKVLIEATYNQGRIDVNHFKIVKGGACAAITMKCLGDQLFYLPAFQRGEGIPSAQTGRHLAIVESIGNYQVDVPHHNPYIP